MARDTMAHLYDANIANLIGSVDAASADGDGSRQHHAATAAALHWFVFEHLPLGDLKQFLRRHRLASPTTTSSTAELADDTLR